MVHLVLVKNETVNTDNEDGIIIIIVVIICHRLLYEYLNYNVKITEKFFYISREPALYQQAVILKKSIWCDSMQLVAHGYLQNSYQLNLLQVVCHLFWLAALGLVLYCI
jgi:hypothetical protein